MSNKTDTQNNKVGIITLYHANYNFGGLLQAYALPKALKEYFGIDAEQIDYIPAAQKLKSQKDNKKGLVQKLYQCVYKLGIFLFDKINKANLNCRKQAFDDFINKIPHSESAYNYDIIDKSLNSYDIFVCGGDQIWNECEGSKNIKVYTLQFVHPEYKKIAYSPSMAIMETSPGFTKIMSVGLNGLDAVSVREKKSLSVLQPLTDKKIQVVVDPVLLLTQSEWSDITTKTDNKGKYILCYLLGDSTEHRKAVKKISKQLHLPIITFPHIVLNAVRKCDLFFGDIHDYTSGPREFINLIKNAEFVVTDSFHACVFSMIFKTPFAVFERKISGENKNMNSRIYDFLEEYHLENRLVEEKQLSEIKLIPKIDFDYAHQHWKERRKESLEYLSIALKIVKETE